MKNYRSLIYLSLAIFVLAIPLWFKAQKQISTEHKEIAIQTTKEVPPKADDTKQISKDDIPKEDKKASIKPDKDTKETIENKEITPTAEGFAGSYLAARVAARNEDEKTASKYYQKSLELGDIEPKLLPQALQHYLLDGQIEKAANTAKSILKTDKKNQLASLVLAIDYIKNEQYQDAKKQLDNITPHGLLSITQPLTNAWIDVANKKTLSKIPVNKQLMQAGFIKSFVHFQKALMLDLSGDTEKAKYEYKQALDSPEEASYRVMIGYLDFLRRNDGEEEAKEVYKSFLEKNTSNLLYKNISVEMIFAELEKSGNKRLVNSVQQGISELLLATSYMLYQEEIQLETIIYLHLALHLRPEFDDAYFLLATVKSARNQQKEAVEIYNKVKRENSSALYRRSQIRRSFALDAIGENEKALNSLKLLANYFPKNKDVLIAAGDISGKNKDFNEAIRYYTAAIAVTSTSKENEWIIHYMRGVSYDESGNWELAEQDLKKALELQPEQPDALNYLGYSWLIKGKNIKEATKMLEKAIAERPEDAHIIDSMGWALYLMGDYAKSLEYLEQAISLMPADVTVNDHLGDALWRTGRKAEARHQWNKAIQFSKDDEIKRKIERKLSEGLSDDKSSFNNKSVSESSLVGEDADELASELEL